MQHEHFAISIAGEEAGDLYADLLGLEIELDDELAAQLRLRLALDREDDGSWRHLDDDRLQAWRQVTVSAGLGDDDEQLFAGYITHVRPSFDPDPARCALELWGLDGSVLLDREEKLKGWPNKKDSDIAGEIFSAYALTPQVDDTSLVHDEKISTVIQRESDMQFLLRLAARNGFECYVEGTTGYFRPPQLGGPPQPVLAVHFGDETNVARFSLQVDALAPANVAMWQLDRADKSVLDASITATQQQTLGRRDASDLLPAGIDPGLLIPRAATTGKLELTALGQGLYHRAAWFVTGEGEVNANRYGHLLRPRRTVTIKGVGEAHSGVYYVAHVTHSFTPEGYTQRFRVRRNALAPAGSEQFAATEEG